MMTSEKLTDPIASVDTALAGLTLDAKEDPPLKASKPLEVESPVLSTHQKFMLEALRVAEKALTQGETPVGCVLVYGDKVVAEGMNDTNRSLNGTRHAEFVAISQFLKTYSQAKLAATDLYVTVEPCIMCAAALRQYQIRAVYYGCANERFGGTGSVMTVHQDANRDPAYKAQGGIYREAAIMLLRRFYLQENQNAPNPRPKKDRELNTIT